MKTNKRNYQTEKQADLSQYVFGKTQPQALPLEEAVLGAIMLDKNAFEKVAEVFGDGANPFYTDQHGAIWEAMRVLFTQMQPIDLLTVMETLKAAGTLDTAGGPAYLAELTHRVASAANIEYHARVVWERHIDRQLIAYSTDLIKQAFEPTSDTPTVLENAERDLLKITHGIGSGDSKTASQVALEEMQRLSAIIDNPSKLAGIPTPFYRLNRIGGGWQKSDLIIVAARPGMGKTGFMLSCARYAAEQGYPIGIFTLEMGNGQLMGRMVASVTGLSNSQLRQPNEMSEQDRAKMFKGFEIVSELPLFLDDTAGITLGALRMKARDFVRRGAKMILVDYLQLMTLADRQGMNREQEISTISRGLKQIAKELDVPVIALSQLSRAVETRGGTKRPQLSDLRDSGAIEQDADIVAFIYRPEYYQIETDENGQSTAGVAELVIAKHRNGPLDTVMMRFEDKTTNFSDPDAPVSNSFPVSGLAPASAMAQHAPGEDEPIPW